MIRIIFLWILCLLYGNLDSWAIEPNPFIELKLTGDALPVIRHMTDMKIHGDTLLFVYECEGGHGQRFLRSGIIDKEGKSLSISSDIGRREDGHYISFMPYPVSGYTGKIQAVGQDDFEIYAIEGNSVLNRTGKYLLDNKYETPVKLSHFIQDIFPVTSDSFVYIGREPNGGRQFAMQSHLSSSMADTIRQIRISPNLDTWLPNMGEMIYSARHNQLAFAYLLHPVIELFGLDGKNVNLIRIGKNTFDPETLDYADFESLNPQHSVDLTSTPDYLYSLYWGNTDGNNPTIYKIDWKGKIVNRYSINSHLRRIAAYDDTYFIGWTGKEFIALSLTQ